MRAIGTFSAHAHRNRHQHKLLGGKMTTAAAAN
jgi:hypothetical protein